MTTTQTPFVAPLGWVQPVTIPVAHTEGGVVLDLTDLLPDLIRAVRARGFDTDDEVMAALQAKGFATPHLSLFSARVLEASLGVAIRDAEEAGTVTETEIQKGI